MYENMNKLYMCLECGEQEIVKPDDIHTDGRVCKKCGGHSSFKAYVGVDCGERV